MAVIEQEFRHDESSRLDQREDIRKRSVVDTGKKVFAGTGIIDPRLPIDGQSIHAARLFLDVAAPDPVQFPEVGSNWVASRGPLEHMLLTAQIARHIAEEVNVKSADSGQVSPNTQEVVGLLHDAGRLVHHRFKETDELTDVLMEQIGIVPVIKESQHKIEWYWDVEKPLPSPTVSQRISVISDVLAKRSTDDGNRLRRPHEVIAEVRLGKEKYLKRPIESIYDLQMHDRIVAYGQRENIILTETIEWLDRLGVDMEPILSNLDDQLKESKLVTAV